MHQASLLLCCLHASRRLNRTCGIDLTQSSSWRGTTVPSRGTTVHSPHQALHYCIKADSTSVIIHAVTDSAGSICVMNLKLLLFLLMMCSVVKLCNIII